MPGLQLGGAREADVVEELAQQLEQRYDEARLRGASEIEARAEAEGQFPRWAEVAAEIRRARTPLTNRLPEPVRREVQRAIQAEDPPTWLEKRKGKLMGDLWMDLRYALRSLGKSPAFAFIAVLTIALGIGANTAIFSVVQAVVLRPLPYPQPEKLMRVYDRHEQSGLQYFSVQPPNLFLWQTEARSLQHVGAYREETVNVAVGRDEPEAVGGARVTASLFDVLGVPTILGRPFDAREDVANGASVAVITHGLWQRRFGGSASALGGSIGIEGQPHTIVGVLPAHFRFPQQDRVEILLPYRLSNDPRMRGAHFLRVLARLRPDASVESALTEMNTMAKREAQNSPGSHAGWTVAALPLHEAVVGDSREPLMVLLGAVGFLLLIACSNVANLLLVRFAARQREMAVRVALGAGRARMVRQLLCEGGILSALGCAAGVALAYGGVQLFTQMRPAGLPRSGDVALDGSVLAFSAGLAVLTGLFFGLAPAMQSFRANVHDVLKEGGRSGAQRTGGFRSALLVSEVALAVALLVGAGLMLQSLGNLRDVHPGFTATDNVLTLPITPLQSAYPEPAQRVTFYRQLVERISAAAGVQSAGIVHRLPLTGNSGTPLLIEGRPVPPQNEVPFVNYRAVSNGYFTALEIPLLRGRFFNEQESWQGGSVVLINQALAQRYWPGEEAVGKRVRTRPDAPPAEVIGVVADVKESGLGAPVDPALYFPYAGRPAPAMTLVVKSSLPAAVAAAEVRRAAREINPSQAAGSLQTLEGFMEQVTAGPRFNAVLLAIFAGLALTLASLGVYGVMSYAVAQRTSEIGIRMALGAQRGDVLRLVLGHGMKLAVLGMLIGIGGSLYLTRWLETLLFGVTARDPGTFAAVSVTLVLVALVACWIPARRALRVDPLVALRHE